MADPLDVLAQHLQRFATAHVAVARVEQQAHFAAGQGHQLVDVRGRLDVGAHVVVIGQAHAPGQGEARQFGELVGVGLPGFIRMETRSLDQ
ncbi:hypothetical protein D3C76_1654040 [compost metagenome]